MAKRKTRRRTRRKSCNCKPGGRRLTKAERQARRLRIRARRKKSMKKIGRFLKRHRKKLIAAGVAGATAGYYKHLLGKAHRFIDNPSMEKLVNVAEKPHKWLI